MYRTRFRVDVKHERSDQPMIRKNEFEILKSKLQKYFIVKIKFESISSGCSLPLLFSNGFTIHHVFCWAISHVDILLVNIIIMGISYGRTKRFFGFSKSQGIFWGSQKNPFWGAVESERETGIHPNNRTKLRLPTWYQLPLILLSTRLTQSCHVFRDTPLTLNGTNV